MNQLRLNSYSRILSNRNFLRFWTGFTLSSVGDSLTRVALTWFVFEKTKSVQALGILTVAYSAPILLGGFFAGPLLDRFSARRVMIFDNLMRGVAFTIIPLLHVMNKLQIWHVYFSAGIYGVLMMTSLAGGPTLIPSILNEEQLDTANAMETLSFTLSNVIGPPLAGVLIVWIGPINVVILDALSYFIFALALLSTSTHEHSVSERSTVTYGIMNAVQLMIENKVILCTTLMFMMFNIGLGALTVFLPVVSNQIAAGHPEIYGVLLGAMALGEVVSAWLAGSLILRLTLGKRIVLAQLLSGLSLLLLLVGHLTFRTVVVGLFLLGFFSAPLTICAQTLRMQIIPSEIRGRMFALLRTLMQGATPSVGRWRGCYCLFWEFNS